MTERILSQV